MMPAFARHDVIPELALDQELPPVPLDQDLVYRAFLNILVNSVQAMPEGGSVRAETRVLKKGVGVEVLLGDTGVGMSIEKQQHVFTPFFTDKNRGSGLGLSIVKNIIDSHGGKIAVESEEGRGTTFRITLPAS
jgi:signal transduction histidine kinase